MHESKFPFVSRIEFIHSKLSNFSAHVYGVSVSELRVWDGQMERRGRLTAAWVGWRLEEFCSLFGPDGGVVACVCVGGGGFGLPELAT